MPDTTILDDLVNLANRLGRPDLDYAILGEGNVSARVDDRTFAVKSSGAELRTLTRAQVSLVRFEPVRAMLAGGDLSDDEVLAKLGASTHDGLGHPPPSVETLMHAVCLSLPGVQVVAHTHPVAVNSLTCAADFERLIAGRLFPDEIVLCGPKPCVVAYIDPGVPLAREMARRIEDYRREVGAVPKVVLLRNHGLVALGSSIRDAENITHMTVKTARILLGTLAAGGPKFLAEHDVRRIQTRRDEHIRQRVIGGESAGGAIP